MWSSKSPENMACRYNAIFTNLMQCSYDDINCSWPKTFTCVVICVVVMTVETILVYFWNEWRSSITFSMNENENKNVFKGIFHFSVEWWWWWQISRRRGFLEGWWSVLACSLVTVESDSWCTDRRVGSLFYTLRTWIWSSVQESLLLILFWNLSGR